MHGVHPENNTEVNDWKFYHDITSTLHVKVQPRPTSYVMQCSGNLGLYKDRKAK